MSIYIEISSNQLVSHQKPISSIYGNQNGDGSVCWTTDGAVVQTLDLLIRLPLGLLWVAGAALGFAQWADGGITMNLLVA